MDNKIPEDIRDELLELFKSPYTEYHKGYYFEVELPPQEMPAPRRISPKMTLWMKNS